MLHLKSPRGWAGLPRICSAVDTLLRHLHLWPPSHRTCAFGHKRDCGRGRVQFYEVLTAMLANPVWYHPSRPGPSLCVPKVLPWRVHEAKRVSDFQAYCHDFSQSWYFRARREHERSFPFSLFDRKRHPDTSDTFAWVLTLLSNKRWELSPGLQLLIQKHSFRYRVGMAESAFDLVWPKHLPQVRWGPSRRQIPGPCSRTALASRRGGSQLPAFGTDLLGDSSPSCVKTAGGDPTGLALAPSFPCSTTDLILNVLPEP